MITFVNLRTNPNLTASRHVRASPAKADPTLSCTTALDAITTPSLFRATSPVPDLHCSMTKAVSKFTLIKIGRRRILDDFITLDDQMTQTEQQTILH
ncbi:hypothetical protein E1A91_D02G140100v1 [Gossypium mustelinum]|uniref:Uncharacterized protein n=1 Tax=Gossypium mustelinum TaxID=34275 RepID=A0A5D2VVI2_GOSMU|nr:hypothetical protein E1A91_D02G140100v1 [Gossypium mustelinum]TYI93507.1 hypothetical protein E1A91_D02G140100v1 [Gossypium mustelinum]TYI93508.1 hypothetical protein E1A91_D02G140100v1 [Gossypium mustelinum]